MTKKELKKQLNHRVYNNETRQQIFEHFDNLYPNRSKDIADLIVDIPTLADRKKYLPHQIILIVLIAISVLLKALYSLAVLQEMGLGYFIMALLVPIINVVLIIGLVQWKPIYFRTVGQLASFGLLQMLFNVGEGTFGVSITLEKIIQNAFFMALAALSFFVYNRLRRKYIGHATQSKDKQGRIFTKYNIRFNE